MMCDWCKIREATVYGMWHSFCAGCWDSLEKIETMDEENDE